MTLFETVERGSFHEPLKMNPHHTVSEFECVVEARYRYLIIGWFFLENEERPGKNISKDGRQLFELDRSTIVATQPSSCGRTVLYRWTVNFRCTVFDAGCFVDAKDPHTIHE
mmetsp:Transcript_48994/g.118668  ORF Transcript_48994/g.118668 Transcript_48994/m.118668 type:complete len:112 (+) Transcript_48994:129-464(+)